MEKLGEEFLGFFLKIKKNFVKGRGQITQIPLWKRACRLLKTNIFKKSCYPLQKFLATLLLQHKERKEIETIILEWKFSSEKRFSIEKGVLLLMFNAMNWNGFCKRKVSTQFSSINEHFMWIWKLFVSFWCGLFL